MFSPASGGFVTLAISTSGENDMTEENRERTREMIKVMQAYVDGEVVEFSLNNNNLMIIDNNTDPQWNWQVFDYRVASSDKPDTINWDHVAPDFKWMARDHDGTCYLYTEKPSKDGVFWYSDCISSELHSHSSYRRGTCGWEDSLVERPK